MKIEDEVRQYIGMLRDSLKEESRICNPDELEEVFERLEEIQRINPGYFTPSDQNVIRKASNKYGIA